MRKKSSGITQTAEIGMHYASHNLETSMGRAETPVDLVRAYQQKMLREAEIDAEYKRRRKHQVITMATSITMLLIAIAAAMFFLRS